MKQSQIFLSRLMCIALIFLCNLPKLYAADAPTNLNIFYSYDNDAGNYGVKLSSAFFTQLTKSSGGILSDGNYTWKTGDPLPNPAPNGMYNNRKVTSLMFTFKGVSGVVNLDLSLWDVTNVKNVESIFEGCNNLESINLSNWNMVNISRMYGMFQNLQKLKTINFANFRTSNNLTNIAYLFYNCLSLTNLDLSSFDTSGVIYMNSCFSNCKSLQSVNLKSFNTTKVENMEMMFYYCSSLKSLDLSNFVTPELQRMNSIFAECYELESVNLNFFNTSNVTSFNSIFSRCKKLGTLNLKSFDTSKVSNFSYMFNECGALKNLDLSNFSGESATNISGMFRFMSLLETLDLSKFSGTNILSMEYLFQDCYSLKTLNIDSLNTPLVTNFYSIFSNCGNLESIQMSNFNTSNATDLSYMFRGCGSLKQLDLSNFDTSNVTNFDYFLNNCTSLSSLNLGKFSTKSAISMRGAFRGCESLIAIDFNKQSFENVTNFSDMFYGCKSLELIDLGNINNKVVNSISGMFNECESLKQLNLKALNTANVTDFTVMFRNCYSLDSIDLSSFETQNATRMNNMFYNCKSLKILNISSFNTEKVTSMSMMFDGCESLESLDLSNFRTPELVNVSYFLSDCFNLKEINLSNFSTSKIQDMSYMFNNCKSLKECNLANFTTDALTDCRYMFNNCYNLSFIDLSKASFSNVRKMNGMFSSCSKNNTNKPALSIVKDEYSASLLSVYYTTGCEPALLKIIPILQPYLSELYKYTYVNHSYKVTLSENFKTEVSKAENGSFSYNNGSVWSTGDPLPNPAPDGKYNTLNITDMSNIFANCNEIKTLNLSEWNTSYVQNFSSMFEGCSSIKSLDLSSFDLSNTALYSDMFLSCGINNNETPSSGIAKNKTTAAIFNNNTITGIDAKKLRFIVSSNDGVFCYDIREKEASLIGMVDQNATQANIPATTTINGLTYTVTSIDSEALSGYKYINSVTIPSTVISIGSLAFYNTYSLKTFNVDSDNKFFSHSISGDIESVGFLYSKDGTSIVKCPTNHDITYYQVPVGVVRLEDGAFEGCSKITEFTWSENPKFNYIGNHVFENATSIIDLELPYNTSYIGDYAFQGSGLKTLRVKNEMPCQLGNLGLFDAKSCDLYVPTGAYSDYINASNWNLLNIMREHQVIIDNLNYTTLYLDYDAKIPENISVYYINKVDGGKAVLKEVKDIIPANTGVILNGEPKTYTFFKTDNAAGSIPDNMLAGSIEDTEINESGFHFYKLSDGNNNIGFYLNNIDGTLNCEANKAYLKVPVITDSPDSFLELLSGEITNIGGVNLESELVDVYSISGLLLRKDVSSTEALKALPAGIYIVGGKKVVKQ